MDSVLVWSPLQQPLPALSPQHPQPFPNPKAMLAPTSLAFSPRLCLGLSEAVLNVFPQCQDWSPQPQAGFFCGVFCVFVVFLVCFFFFKDVTSEVTPPPPPKNTLDVVYLLIIIYKTSNPTSKQMLSQGAGVRILPQVPIAVSCAGSQPPLATPPL